MFLTPIMLAGILGAAVPLVLHLLSRARHRTVNWGAMMFLAASDSRQQRNIRLKQWILLAIRMAIVSLLAIALARPVAAGRAGTFGQSAPVTAVILLDNSGSMNAALAGHSRLDLARQAAGQVLATLHPGDKAALLMLAGNDPNPAVPLVTSDLQSIREQLQNVSAESAVADIADGLRRAADCFEHADSPNRELFLIGDRQAINWRDVSQPMIAAWTGRMAAHGSPPRFEVIPVGGWESDNIAVESISLPAPQILIKQPIDIQVTVRNYGPIARPNLALSIQIDHQQVATASVNILPNAAASVRQTLSIATAGSHLITATVDPPGVPGDNQLSRAVEVIAPIGVLIIRDAAPASTPPAPNNATPINPASPDYLKLALSPFASTGSTATDIAAVQIMGASDIPVALDQNKFRVVILDGITQLTDAQARTLQQYVYGGGGVLIVPGPSTHIDNLNQMLNPEKSSILPARLSPPAAPETAAPDPALATSIASVDLSHPVFRFLDRQPDVTSPAIVHRFFPAAATRPDARVLARFASGSPFVISGSFGRGRVLLLTTPLDARWTTLPLTNLYLPLVQSMVRYLADLTDRNLKPGEPIIARFDRADAGAEAVITSPDGQAQNVPLLNQDDGAQVRFTKTSRPGIYTVVSGQKSLQYVVARPPEEADLTPLPAERWQTLSRDLGFEVIDPATLSLPSALAINHPPREVGIYVLAAMMLLAIAEIALARRWSSTPARRE